MPLNGAEKGGDLKRFISWVSSQKKLFNQNFKTEAVIHGGTFSFLGNYNVVGTLPEAHIFSQGMNIESKRLFRELQLGLQRLGQNNNGQFFASATKAKNREKIKRAISKLSELQKDLLENSMFHYLKRFPRDRAVLWILREVNPKKAILFEKFKAKSLAAVRVRGAVQRPRFRTGPSVNRVRKLKSNIGRIKKGGNKGLGRVKVKPGEKKVTAKNLPKIKNSPNAEAINTVKQQNRIVVKVKRGRKPVKIKKIPHLPGENATFYDSFVPHARTPDI
ncbi:hypothetical protein ACFL35_13130 [Candidatus Riflebacteria bacterium]